jgi:hypothetical protein
VLSLKRIKHGNIAKLLHAGIDVKAGDHLSNAVFS